MSFHERALKLRSPKLCCDALFISKTYFLQILLSSCMSKQNNTISPLFTPFCLKWPWCFGRNWGRCKGGGATNWSGVWCHKGSFFFSTHARLFFCSINWEKSSFSVFRSLSFQNRNTDYCLKRLVEYICSIWHWMYKWGATTPLVWKSEKIMQFIEFQFSRKFHFVQSVSLKWWLKVLFSIFSALTSLWHEKPGTSKTAR